MTKLKRCKYCKTEFEPKRPLQSVCSPVCAIEQGKRNKASQEAKKALAERKERRIKLDKLKTRSQWLKEAQAAFNAFVRERDRDLPCVSCGRFHTGSYDAGHYRSVGAAAHLRFNEDNCHKQCVPCNQYKGGNVLEYRKLLIQRIGADRVGYLENSAEIVKYTIEDAKRIKAEYKAKLKELKNV